jgi:hypothetical protein
VRYLLTCDNLVIERLLFVIEPDQDIQRQALAEGQEKIITVVRESGGGYSIKPIATEPPDRTTKDAFHLHNGRLGQMRTPQTSVPRSFLYLKRI